MSLAAKSFSVTATTAQYGWTETERITINHPLDKKLYFKYQSTANGIKKIVLSVVSNDFASMLIELKAPQDLLPGEYKDKVTIFACYDQKCNRQIANSPQTIPVDYTVKVVPPEVDSISPDTVAPGNGAFNLSIYGLGFLAGATVYWDGSPRETTVDSLSQVTASISAADVDSAGTATVKVVNAAPRSGISNGISFPVQYGKPSIVEMLPPTSFAGDAAFTLKVVGNGYGHDSQVLWNGNPLTTQPVSGKELTAQVGAGLVANVGTAQVTVRNPVPGSASSPATFTVKPVTSDAVAAQVNANHSGVVHFSTVTFPSSAAWHEATSGDASYALIANGKVFTATQGLQPQLSAFNQDTGALSWGPLDLPGPAKAAYDGGTIFALSLVASDDEGTLQAYDAGTGALEWTTQLSGQWGNGVGGFFGGLTALYGLVYGSPAGGNLFAVNEADGSIAWTGVNGGEMGGPAVTPYGVYSTCKDFQPDTGTLIWEIKDNCSSGAGVPAVANAKLYLPNGNQFDDDVYDAQTGTHLGAHKADVAPAIDKNNGYFLTNGALKDVDLDTGDVVWSFSGDGDLATAPIKINQYVIVGSLSGNIYAIDSTTGNEVWKVNLRDAIPGGNSYDMVPDPLLSAGNGLLIVGAYDMDQSGGGDWIIAYRLASN